MECEELHDALNNSELSEQEIPLEDFGDCKLKSKLYVGMQFDSLDGVEIFYKEFAKKEDFGIRIHTSKRAPKSDNVTSRIYVCCNEGQCKIKKTFDNGEQRWWTKGSDKNEMHSLDFFSSPNVNSLFDLQLKIVIYNWKWWRSQASLS